MMEISPKKAVAVLRGFAFLTAVAIVAIAIIFAMLIISHEVTPEIATPAQLAELVREVPHGEVGQWMHSYISKSEEGHETSRTLIFRLFVWIISYGGVTLAVTLVLSFGLQKYKSNRRDEAEAASCCECGGTGNTDSAVRQE